MSKGWETFYTCELCQQERPEKLIVNVKSADDEHYICYPCRVAGLEALIATERNQWQVELSRLELAAHRPRVCVAEMERDALPFGAPIETQATVTAWQNQTFPDAKGNLASYVLRCFEEMVELALAAGHSYEQLFLLVEELNIRDKKNRTWSCPHTNPAEVPGELADVLIVLYGCAGAAGVSLQDEVDRKMAINRARKWRHRADGHAEHVKESA